MIYKKKKKVSPILIRLTAFTLGVCLFNDIGPPPLLQILSEWFGRSVIRSCVKLSYDHAQSMIDAPDKMFSAEELPPTDPEHPVDEIHQAVLHLHSIAKNLRAQRFSGGALRLDQVSPHFLRLYSMVGFKRKDRAWLSLCSC